MGYANFVFRDIKGANIFLTDDMKNLKLGDYGSAVKIKQHTTMPGELQGHVGTQGGYDGLIIECSNSKSFRNIKFNGCLYIFTKNVARCEIHTTCFMFVPRSLHGTRGVHEQHVRGPRESRRHLVLGLRRGRDGNGEEAVARTRV